MLNVELKQKMHILNKPVEIFFTTIWEKNNYHVLIMERGSEFGQNVTKTHLHKLNAETTFGHTCCSLPLS